MRAYRVPKSQSLQTCKKKKTLIHKKNPNMKYFVFIRNTCCTYFPHVFALLFFLTCYICFFSFFQCVDHDDLCASVFKLVSRFVFILAPFTNVTLRVRWFISAFSSPVPESQSAACLSLPKPNLFLLIFPPADMFV